MEIADSTEFLRIINEDPHIIAAMFTRNNCPNTAAICDKLQELSKSYPCVNFVKILAEQVPGLFKSLSIMQTPTFLFFVDGENISRVNGADLELIKKKLNDCLALHKKKQALRNSKIIPESEIGLADEKIIPHPIITIPEKKPVSATPFPENHISMISVPQNELLSACGGAINPPKDFQANNIFNMLQAGKPLPQMKMPAGIENAFGQLQMPPCFSKMQDDVDINVLFEGKNYQYKMPPHAKLSDLRDLLMRDEPLAEDIMFVDACTQMPIPFPWETTLSAARIVGNVKLAAVPVVLEE